MKDAMLQVQLLVPSLQTDATVTANLKRDEELELMLHSDIKLPMTTSEQTISLKYGTNALYNSFFCSVFSQVIQKFTNCPNISVYTLYLILYSPSSR